MLVYLLISDPNNIYLVTTNEFICWKLVEIKMLIDTHLIHRCIFSYFDIFNLLSNYQESFINNKIVKTTLYFFYLISLYLAPLYKDG